MYSHVHVRSIVNSESTTAVAQWVECSNGMRKVVFSNLSRHRPKLFKQVVTVPLPNASRRCECHGSSEMTL